MIALNQNTLSVILIGILIIFAAIGYHKGFLQELYSIASVIAAIILSVVLIKNMLQFKSGPAYLAVFFIVMFLIRWGGKLLNIVDHIPIIGGINKFLGAIVGLLKGCIILFIIYRCIGKVIFPELMIPF